MRRLTRADAQLWKYQFEELQHLPKDTPLGRIYMLTDTIFARLQRHIKGLERSYKDAARELTLLQSAGATEPHPQPPQPVETEPTYAEI